MNADPKEMVLWSDDSLLVINKPAGLLTLPDGYQPDAPHLRSVLQPVYGRLWIVHRLDKETSGVVALARSAEAHRALNTQFQQREASKIYHALVSGVPDWEEKEVDAPLLPNGDRRHRTIVDPQRGKQAVTHFHVLERFSQRITLLEAAPKTGRPHQIRAHLAYLGYPILADGLYGGLTVGGPAGLGNLAYPAIALSRLGLHAWSLEIEHPTTGENLCFVAPYPADFDQALDRLRNFFNLRAQ